MAPGRHRGTPQCGTVPRQVPRHTRKLRAAAGRGARPGIPFGGALVIDLSGRVVIVTGGNSGIGLGIARGVARAGASVAIWSRRSERNAEAVAELAGLGVTAIGVQCDVSDEANVAAAMRATLGRFGRLDSRADPGAGPVPGRPPAARVPAGRRGTASEQGARGLGPSGAPAGGGPGHGAGGPADVRAAAGRAQRGADHPGAERRRDPVPVRRGPGAEPAPDGCGVDAAHGGGDPGQPAVHGPAGVEPAAHRLSTWSTRPTPGWDISRCSGGTCRRDG